MTIGPQAPERPKWLRAPAPVGQNYRELKELIADLNLHTVCESAACPNVGECWNRRTATFMILGNVCTRRCGFCAVQKGAPLPVDYDEPRRVAEAVAAMGLRYAVVTSVNRDDRKDGGAELFALTIEAIRERIPGCKVEVLVPDFQGSHAAMKIVMDARPDVLNHNTETVPRLYRQVRLGARYERSLDMLRYAKELRPETPVKSGLMLGLGETQDEVLQVMRDLRAHRVDILTLGQYLRPSPKHLPIVRYVPPAEFDDYRRAGARNGLRACRSRSAGAQFLSRRRFARRGRLLDGRPAVAMHGRMSRSAVSPFFSSSAQSQLFRRADVRGDRAPPRRTAQKPARTLRLPLPHAERRATCTIISRAPSMPRTFLRAAAEEHLCVDQSRTGSSRRTARRRSGGRGRHPDR